MLNRRKFGSVAAGAVGIALCTFAVVKPASVRAVQPAAVDPAPAAAPAPVVKVAARPVVAHTSRPDPLRGLATWYGRVLHGHRTASGESFDEGELTAASRTLPLGSTVRVSDVTTGRSVVVRINDRGTLAPGRVIDLSSAAAEVLGMIERGVAMVKLEVLAHVHGKSESKPSEPRSEAGPALGPRAEQTAATVSAEILAPSE